jgi:hypothetical protein
LLDLLDLLRWVGSPFDTPSSCTQGDEGEATFAHTPIVCAVTVRVTCALERALEITGQQANKADAQPRGTVIVDTTQDETMKLKHRAVTPIERQFLDGVS